MEDGSEKWNFQGNKKLNASSISVRGVYNMLMERVNNSRDKKPLVPLCRVDPTENPLFRTTPEATDSVSTAVNSYNFNCYPPTVGLPDAKRAIANYLSSDLPYQLSPENVFLTIGGTQAIDIILPALARSDANILLPRPGYPQYDSRASCCLLEVRHFDLLPERGWEVDLDSLESQADENTVAMVLINPSNPCGNVFTYQHLKRVAEIARKLGIFVISDEVYAHVTYGSNPFVPMGVFSSIVPVITIGSLSKRWLVPGWRTGWIATCDPHGIFQKTGVVKSIISYLEITTDPPTFLQLVSLQAAIPEILGKTKDDFLSKNLNILRETANIFYDLCKEIPCLTCPHKPEGAMCVMVEINFSQIKDIVDDMDFCAKLAEEESVLLLPGVTVGLKNWLRISFAVDTSNLVEGLSRIKAFCLRYAKMP
ncbi:hypothetical protein JHK82_034510 [Glycine max]|uniref:probable aminotransferase TAT2 isoform X1 n=1 Tax=Glycine soja TaxID=3848 RepID=UPI0007192F46|nr:probable aminotransferase TAT2 isoform X1 [Glycine soja]KAG4386035.1 hypothetical protein GLYMA_12G205900v4 [Glycine max]KAG4968807.1 hypothetical protein JHK87_034458 [Glycine soja]KAG4981268.1 hypothetical protein JHK85_035226 [Glycine max]KAG5120090.1 hypothetical protein JHK82_034510 [Glycine max]KAG5141077.1 hypothetical protein JHK84_034845 [Glycine max]|eukprot:XP_014619815.1 uncharacterized protein LOC100787587 isoform X1 [Glycine max]